MKVLVCLKLAILTFFLLTCSNSKQIPPKAVKGVLDLRNWDFDPPSGSGTDGVIKLDGEWEFFWQEFPVGDGLELPEEKKDFISVPSVWNGHIVKRTTESGEVIEEKLGAEGYATYRLKVLLGEEQTLALRLPDQGTAYTLIANNIVVHKSGTIGKNREDSLPARNVEYINLDNRDKELNLLVSISNFHHQKGGLWNSIILGSNRKIQNLHSNTLSLNLFVIGILFIMGVYHLSLFSLRREDKSPLYFGLFCLLISLRTLLTGDRYLHSLIPNLGYSLGVHIEYLTLYLGTPLGFEFLSTLYSQEVRPILRKILLVSSLIFSSFVIALPPIYFTKLLPVVHVLLLFSILYSIYILINSIRRKREGAKTFLSGFIFFGMIIVNDILHANGIINTGQYAPIGLVVLIFSQSFLLTSRFANAFRQVNDLTQNLEKKVEERTTNLALANQEIADSKKETEELNDLIKNINSVSSLTDVMMFLMYYLETNYAYNSFWLVLYDKNNNRLQTTVCVSSTLSENAINYLKSLSLNPEDSHSICTCYTEQKMIYREKEDPLVSKQDNDIIDQTQFGYLFHLPFVVYGDCIGILTLHKADGLAVPQVEQTKMGRFTELISGAVYNSILYRDSQVAKEQAEESFQKARNLNDMIEVIIQSKSTDEIFGRIFDLFSEKYGLTSYLVYILDKEDGFIKLYKLFGDININDKYLDVLRKNIIPLSDPYSIIANCILNNNSFIIKNVRLPHLCKIEEENIILGGIDSFYIIPLSIDKESFGTFLFSNNKFQRSNIKGLTKTVRVEIENFVKLISPSIYQSLQKNLIEKAFSELSKTKSELESQKAQMERLQAMSQEIQRKTSFEEMLRSLEEILWDSYKIGDYTLAIHNPELEVFELISVGQHWLAHSLDKKIKSIPLSENKSIHTLVFIKKRSLYLPKFKNISNGKAEDYNRNLLGMESIFAIPCIVNNESFAVLSCADVRAEYTKDHNIKGVKRLTYKQREEIEQLVSLIANALYQSLQKAKIEKAYTELQETQAQLLEAERMSSLGQLVGSIAHEINNPIGVIRSQSEQLARNIQATLKEIPQFLESLTTSEKELFYEMVSTSTKATESLTTKEERAKRKEIFREIETLVGGTEEVHTDLTEEILLLKLPSPYNRYVDELDVPRFKEFLSNAMIFKNQTNAISNIEIAVEKSSRVVFALRSYLNTDLAFANREINLVEEVEKALHVYDNYVMGKINVRKDFPSELKYTCIPENLSQVWKNLFFNAIQAMYTTDKKLAIRIEKKEKLSDELKSYRTSSIVEDSVFQANDVSEWILVSITDSGTGIADDLQPKVFTPFFTTKSLGEGIGLGLYVCKKIVHEHGGAMFFRSGEGSTEFVVVLPM
jgi:signal transduction histidine kinase